MILLLDIGNTRMKWAFLEEGELRHMDSALRLDKEFKDIARGNWAELDPPPTRVLVCNVAGPALKKSANLWIKRRWKVGPEFVQASAEAGGVHNAYEQPRQLGADRWAALIAARHESKGPACVIDCGTAITIDAINTKGSHLGGLIIPGLSLMARSLIDRAPDIHEPEPDNAVEEALFARDTDNAVTAGAIYAAVSLLDRAIADVKMELGQQTAVLLTGGDAERIAPLLASKTLIEPHLVLKGLARLAQETPCDT